MIHISVAARVEADPISIAVEAGVDVPSYDIFVIGGGINGCGIASDAVGRGYSVCLAEMEDLASGTSSAQPQPIHGGLRHLAYYRFPLARRAPVE